MTHPSEEWAKLSAAQKEQKTTDLVRAREDLARARYVQPAEDALHHLRQALAYSKEAKSRETVKVIRLAISSAKGAVRAASYRAARQAEQVQS